MTFRDGHGDAFRAGRGYLGVLPADVGVGVIESEPVGDGVAQVFAAADEVVVVGQQAPPVDDESDRRLSGYSRPASDAPTGILGAGRGNPAVARDHALRAAFASRWEWLQWEPSRRLSEGGR